MSEDTDDNYKRVGVSEMKARFDANRNTKPLEAPPRKAKQVNIDLSTADKPVCPACESQVYPTDSVNLGAQVFYHRQCLRCCVCNTKLQLDTFKRDPNKDAQPLVYCKQHVPKLGSTAQIIYTSTTKKNRASKHFEEAVNAQELLESRHMREEHLLYKAFEQKKEEEIEKLRAEVDEERAKSVKELIAMFEKLGSNADRQLEMQKIKAKYDKLYEDKFAELLTTLRTDHRDKVANLLDKQSKEMLRFLKERNISKINDAPALERIIESAENQQSQETLATGTKDILNETSTAHYKPDSDNLVPDVLPPIRRKEEVLTNLAGRFKHVDELCSTLVKEEVDSSWTQLIQRITADCENEYEKIRIIFRWIALKNLDEMQFEEDLVEDSPWAILKQIKAGHASYHDLFKRMCSYAGIHCEIIYGYSKGLGYRPGMNVKSSAFRNAWTAAYVEGCWHLLNCNWGARHWKSKEQGGSKMSYRFDEFYFLTDPEKHIYEHFPDEEKWQLLEKPLTLPEFEDLPMVKSPFYNNRLYWTQKLTATVHSDTGILDLEFGKPADDDEQIFGVHLEPGAKQDGINPEDCKQRAIVRVMPDKVRIKALLPAVGSYTLSVFTNDTLVNAGNSPSGISLDLACSLHIQCDSLKEFAKCFNLPPVKQLGQNRLFGRLELKVADDKMDPYSTCDNGKTSVAFLYKNPNIKSTHSLKYFDQSTNNFEVEDGFCMPSRNTSSSTLKFDLRLNKRGFYVFTLYADEGKPGERKSLESVYKMLIWNENAQHEPEFPVASSYWIDATLISPTHGTLPRSDNIDIEMNIGGVFDVSFVMGDIWQNLNNEGSNWKRVISTNDSSEPVGRVYAKFSETSTSFKPLLEFHIHEEKAN